MPFCSANMQCREALFRGAPPPNSCQRLALPLLIGQDNNTLEGLECGKGIGYAIRVALLGHYSMVVHHDERSSDGQNCGLGSYFLSTAGMVYPYIRRFSTLAIKQWRLWCRKMWGVGSLRPPNIILGANDASWRGCLSCAMPSVTNKSL